MAGDADRGRSGRLSDAHGRGRSSPSPPQPRLTPPSTNTPLFRPRLPLGCGRCHASMHPAAGHPPRLLRPLATRLYSLASRSPFLGFGLRASGFGFWVSVFQVRRVQSLVPRVLLPLFWGRGLARGWGLALGGAASLFRCLLGPLVGLTPHAWLGGCRRAWLTSGWGGVLRARSLSAWGLPLSLWARALPRGWGRGPAWSPVRCLTPYLRSLLSPIRSRRFVTDTPRRQYATTPSLHSRPPLRPAPHYPLHHTASASRPTLTAVATTVVPSRPWSCRQYARRGRAPQAAHVYGHQANT